MKYFSHLFGVLAILTLWSIPSHAVTLYQPESIVEDDLLGMRQGYVLIELDVDGTSSSLQFSQIRTRGQNYLKPGRKLTLKQKKYTFSFIGKPAGFYLAKLPYGLYQITQVKVPYFELPYRLSFENSRKWRFSVEAEMVNFIGKLEIKKKRVEKAVTINLINRIAANKNAIESKLSNLLSQYPLRSGVGVRDDFLSELNSSVEN